MILKNYRTKKKSIAKSLLSLFISFEALEWPLGVSSPLISLHLFHDYVAIECSRKETRPDTRLPKSHVGGQGLYLRSLDHLGSEVKEIKL